MQGERGQQCTGAALSAQCTKRTAASGADRAAHRSLWQRQGTVYGLLDNVIVSPVSAPLADHSSLPDPSHTALLVRVLVGVLTSTRGVPKVFYTRIDEIYRSILLQTGIKVPTGGCPPARVSPEQPSQPSRFRHSTRPQLR